MLAGAAPADLVTAVQAAWGAFVHSGDPGTAHLPEWPVHLSPGDVLRLDRSDPA